MSTWVCLAREHTISRMRVLCACQSEWAEQGFSPNDFSRDERRQESGPVSQLGFWRPQTLPLRAIRFASFLFQDSIELIYIFSIVCLQNVCAITKSSRDVEIRLKMVSYFESFLSIDYRLRRQTLWAKILPSNEQRFLFFAQLLDIVRWKCISVAVDSPRLSVGGEYLFRK